MEHGGGQMIRFALLSACALSLGLAGCASDGPKSNPEFSSKTEPLSFEEGQTGQIDLVSLIDPENRRAQMAGAGCVPEPVRGKKAKAAAARAELECALRAFKTYHLGTTRFQAALAEDQEAVSRGATGSVALAVRRNDIQDRVLMRSNALCEDFQRRLDIELRIQNDTSFGNWLRNSQTRIVGGAGALLLNSDAVWALTSATRITGLPSYVADEGQIEKATMRIAAEGMRQQRAAMLAGIDARRAKPPRYGGLRLPSGDGREGLTPVTEYSLERALGDALDYHAACSVNRGLDYVQDVMSRNRPVPVAVSFPALQTEEAHGAEEADSILQPDSDR